MIGYYNYTVLLTYGGLTSALIGLFLTIQGHPAGGIICLLISGLCDMFDGKVARTRKRTENEKNFGIQIDSLCDLICFGVLPAVICFEIGMREWYYQAILVLFVLCGLIRLAFYNVSEINREKETTGARKSYLGLPITFSAIFVPMIFVFQLVVLQRFLPWLTAIVVGAVGAAYITPFSISKPGKFKIGVLIGAGVLMIALIIWSVFFRNAG